MLGFYMLCYNSYYINFFSNVLNNKLKQYFLTLFDFITLTIIIQSMNGQMIVDNCRFIQHLLEYSMAWVMAAKALPV